MNYIIIIIELYVSSCVTMCDYVCAFWPTEGFKRSAMVCQRLELVVVAAWMLARLHRSRMQAARAAQAAKATLALRQQGFPRANLQRR